MLQGEEIPGSYWEVSQGAAAVERDPCRRRDHRIRGEPPEPSRAKLTEEQRRAVESSEIECYDSLTGETPNPVKTAAAIVLNEPL